MRHELEYPIKLFSVDDLKIALNVPIGFNPLPEQTSEAYNDAIPLMEKLLEDGFYFWADKDEVGYQMVINKHHGTNQLTVQKPFMFGMPGEPQISASYTINGITVLVNVSRGIHQPERLIPTCEVNIFKAHREEEESFLSLIGATQKEADWAMYELDLGNPIQPWLAKKVLSDLQSSTVDHQKTTEEYLELRETMEEGELFDKTHVVWARDYVMRFPSE